MQRARSPREESTVGGWHLGRMRLLMTWWTCSGMRQVTVVQPWAIIKTTYLSLHCGEPHGLEVIFQHKNNPSHHTAQHCRPHVTDSMTSCTSINNRLELAQRHRVPFHNSCCLSSLSRYKTVFFLTSCDPLHIYTISNPEWLPASLPKFCKEVLVCMTEILYPLADARIKLVTAYKMLIVLLK